MDLIEFSGNLKPGLLKILQEEQHHESGVQLYPNLIACGVDAIEPIQKVVGLDADDLKSAYGDVLLFQGGVDTQGVLPNGTPEEVKKETERLINAFWKNGGYILAPSQDFEGDVPVENILALYEARKSFPW